MRAPSTRLLAIPALLLAMTSLSGCPDYEKMASEELASKGLADVQLAEKRGAGHSWDFTATEGGIPCTGTITASAMPGSSAATFSVDKVCKDPDKQEKKGEPVDPLAEERAACDGGELGACTELGEQLVDGDLAVRDVDAARVVHRKACDGGAQRSCARLGHLWARGLGGEQDEDKALALYTGACDGGEMLGCALLGRLHYINRRGKDARKVLERACDGGSILGCDSLGAVLKEGIGGKQDLKRARDLFDTACQAGEPSGCANLGVMYAKGEGVVRSPERAKALLQKACEAEIPAACQHLERLR